MGESERTRSHTHEIYAVRRTKINASRDTVVLFLVDSRSGSTLSFYCNQFITVIILNRQSVIRHIRHDIYQPMSDTNAAHTEKEREKERDLFARMACSFGQRHTSTATHQHYE